MSPRSKSKDITFNRRFKVPTTQKILKALKVKNAKHEKLFVNLLKHFDTLSKPIHSLDWLVQFNEPGQDCSQFINSTPFIGSELIIYYVQIGDFKHTNLKFDDLIEYSKCFFQEKSVRLLPVKIEIEQEENSTKMELKAVSGSLVNKLKFRHDPNSNKIQILTESLHKFLSTLKPKDASCLIGFTEYDLYEEESDLFVAGLCNGDLGVGVFSCIRYSPRIKYSEEHWFDFKLTKSKLRSKQDYTTLLTRSCKLLTHETCHLLGIDHCIYMNCSMNGSGHLEEDFRQSMFLCPIDLKKISILFDFDLKERYKCMKMFFDRHHAKLESEWIQNVLDKEFGEK